MDSKYIAAELAYRRAQRDTNLALVQGDEDALRRAQEQEDQAHQRLLAVAEAAKRARP